MKKYFTSGLAILLPIVLTLMIVSFLINFLTQPFLESTQALLKQSSFLRHSFIHHATFLALLSKMLILLILSGIILLIGVFGKLFLIDAFFRFGDYLLHQLPFVNKIYKACQDVVHSLFTSSKKFSQVVFVPFPSPDSLCIGLVTHDSLKLRNCQQESEHLISVFIPGTPNPSVGFMLMFKRGQLLFANMKVDEAMKFIVSCGVVMPHFEILQPDKTNEKQFLHQSHFLPCERQCSQDSPDLHKSAGSF